MTAPGREVRARLPRGERREQLLDAAAAVVADEGPDGLTMEGVAQRAGVSKALPYQHFSDAEDVLLALAVREAAVIAERTSAVMSPGLTLEEGLGASLRAYFDVVEERGTLLGAIFQYRFKAARQQEVQEVWAQLAGFFAQRFTEEHGLPKRLSLAAAYTFLTAVVGAQQVWLGGLVTRDQAEEILLRMIVDGLAGLAAELIREGPHQGSVPSADGSVGRGGS